MSDTQTALTPTQQFNVQLEEQVKHFRALLPSHIPVDKFKRVVVVAISQNPDLFKANRRSLFTAAQRCASDGLLPDGRQAALVIYGNQVQYMPMIAGVRQRMRNSGEVLSAEAHVVYRNDKFFQKFGDDPGIVHEPPPLGVERGDPVGAYAIIKLKNGEVLRETMDKQQIDRVRAVSKSANGPAWKGWWDEMARKAVLRRCAKAAPTSADIDELLERDDESSSPSMVDITPQEPEPPRAGQITHEPQELEFKHLVIDCDGEEHAFDDDDSATRKLVEIFDEAARRGPGHLEAARENNATMIAEFGDPHGDLTPPHSPAGSPVHPPTKGQHSAAPEPAGDAEVADLLGDKPRPSFRLYLPGRPTSIDWDGWEKAMYAMIEAGDPPADISAHNKDNLAILEQVDLFRHYDLMRALVGGRG